MPALTLVSGSPQTLNSAGAKFGSFGRSAGLFYSAGADNTLSATGTDGGVLTNGTVEMWFNRASNATGNEVLIGHFGWWWIGFTGSGTIQWQVGSGSSVATTVVPSTGAWHHIAIQFIAGQPYLLLDGTVIAVWASTNVTSANTGYVFGIGCAVTTSGSGQFISSVSTFDEIAISSTAQYPTANAFNATYAVPTAAFSNSRPGQVSLWHLENDLADSNAPVVTPAIAATDASIVYSPGNWGTASSNRKTINAGAYFRLAFTAGSGLTAVALGFDLTNTLTPLPQIAHRIDDGPWTVAEIATSVSVTLPAGNTWSKHVLEVVVKATTENRTRWASTSNTEVVFTGITPTGGTVTAVTTRPRSLKGIVLGDSITEGVKTLRTGAAKDTDNNDSRVGYAWLLGAHLGAEIGVVGFGGQGLGTTGAGSVPVVGTTYSSVYSGGPDRDFTGVDFVVINQGTNDGPMASGAFVAAYTALLNGVLSATPDAAVFAMRPLNGTHAADVQAAIAGCSAPKRVFFVDTTGFFDQSDSADTLHPFGHANIRQIAPLVAASIKAGLAVKKTALLNIGGVTIPAVAFGA